MMNTYNSVICGGTFDLLHKGHKDFLKFIFSKAESVVIGLTSDIYTKQFKPKLEIESFEIRKTNLEQFLEKKDLIKRSQLISIDDPIGPAFANQNLEAIIVTDETVKGADLLNKKRIKNGFPPLKIVVFDQVQAEDGKPISSDRIRNGEINREGKVYLKEEWLKNNLTLPEGLRVELRKPFGELWQTEDWLLHAKYKFDSTKTITVGDIVTKVFNEKNLSAKVSIVDFVVARKKEFDSISDLGFKNNEIIIEVNNEAGKITSELFKVIKSTFDGTAGRIVIIIRGEEDLAVLPVILCSPLGFVVFYGQPNQGIVKVEVNEDMKEKAYDILDQFI